VIIVEDIVDTGLTLDQMVRATFEAKGRLPSDLCFNRTSRNDARKRSGLTIWVLRCQWLSDRLWPGL